MKRFGSGKEFFEYPHATVRLLVTINVVAFGLCLNLSGDASIAGDVLFRGGAMYSGALERHEYWRLVAYGFLHANFFHLVTNMMCLVLWGGHLEKRLGALYFTFVYLCAVIAGGAVSNFVHSGAYLMVGASGGISGILGALLCLWFLGKTDLSGKFFIINLGLNIALAATTPRIDWGAHFGGLAAGLISCAFLDILERVNAFLLRCKFPEFVKINGCAALAALALFYWGSPHAEFFDHENTLLFVALVSSYLAVKLIDLTLSIKKGLAILVIAFSLINSFVVVFMATVLNQPLAAQCAILRLHETSRFEKFIGNICASSNVLFYWLPPCVFVGTLLFYWPEFSRGLKDVGFVGPSLRAERRRRRGL